MRTHYPRTPHLPWSPGATTDDIRLGGLSGLTGREVVVTEKLDGENTTLYPDGLHARSLDSAHHPSRTWVKGLHARIAHAIPDGWRICGENVYAQHSIGYADLESWFYAFSVWTGEYCLDWDTTVRFTRRLGIPVPPVLWRGTFDERAIQALRLDLSRQEGYVVRTVAGFDRAEFADRVAKWVRPAHVQTDVHWMSAPVVANGLGRPAPLWEARSGGLPACSALLSSLGLATEETGQPGETGQPEDSSESKESEESSESEEDGDAGVEEVVAECSARLDLLGRTGDLRLAGVLAALLHRRRRSELAACLLDPLGMPLARRVADLVGLYPRLHREFPDEQRRAGLIWLATAADLGVLHAVAGAALARQTGTAGAEAREQVEWSALHAEDAGLLGPAPLRRLRLGLREALAGDNPARDHGGNPNAGPNFNSNTNPGCNPGCNPDTGPDPDVADRCWAQAREAYALGRISTPEEAAALTWRWRAGRFPRLVMMVGPAASGKSSFATAVPGATVISLDDLRAARGSRADQRDNREVLREGLARLDGALASGGTVVWDATSLTSQQRQLVHAVAGRRDALVTHGVAVVGAEELARRNNSRRDNAGEYAVPAEVLAGQLRRFAPPYPGEAHRIWYVGPGGTVDDVAGAIEDPFEDT